MTVGLKRRDGGAISPCKRGYCGEIYTYLSEQAKQSGSYQFTIPFNRQQLADYLGVDRSAMSNELSKLQREGLLTFEKNRFSLAQEM